MVLISSSKEVVTTTDLVQEREHHQVPHMPLFDGG